ncbi:M4 family metallopeptidase [Pseudoalteromonas luteoviolacea]|uniref:M4 family metallopeptidase n=1 Tax=Pseudoalteromonas luteoviolacea TaxID=43657 RepID=UPI001EEF2135|nr:M4 family metallopeptidase [Pseudoalteromonas luteoviolacea]MCF6441563.1 M4 family metallopeptidase [Pseudoalteromonas luteoviolacea]
MRIGGFPVTLGMVGLSLIGAGSVQAVEFKPLINQTYLWNSSTSNAILTSTYSTIQNTNTQTELNTLNALEHRLIKVKGEKIKYEHYQSYFNGYPIIGAKFVLINNHEKITQGLGQLISLNNSSQLISDKIFQLDDEHFYVRIERTLKATGNPESFTFKKVYKAWKGSLIPTLLVRVKYSNKIEERHFNAATLQLLEKKSAVDNLMPENAEYVAAGGIGGNEKVGAVCYSPSLASMTNCLSYQFNQDSTPSTELIFHDNTQNIPLIFREFGGYPFIVKKVGTECFYENQYVKTIDYPVDKNAAFSFDCSTGTEHFDKTKIDDFYWHHFSYSGINDAHFYGGLVMQYYHKLFAQLYPTQVNDCSESGYCIKQLMQRVSNDSLGSQQAFWDDTYTNYGTGNGGATTYSHTTLSLIAHESAHAITYWNSGLEGNGEAGAFNEAFSDIASIAVLDYFQSGMSGSYSASQAFLDQTSDNGNALKDRKWWYAWDVFNADIAGRYFALPSADGKGLDHLSERQSGESHYNIAGLFRKAYYELVKSKNWTVEEAFKLFIKANVECLPSNASLDDAAFCLISQASNFNVNRTAEQAQSDVDNVLVSVGLTAQNSNKSTFDLDVVAQYDEIAFNLTAIPVSEIAQIDISWGDGHSDSWSHDSAQAIHPFLTHKKAIATDALNVFELTITKQDNTQLYAARHYFSKNYGSCAPIIHQPNILLSSNVSLNETAFDLTNHSYQSVSAEAATVNRDAHNSLVVGEELNGKAISVLLDSNYDGTFSADEILTRDASVSNGQITFTIDNQVRPGKTILRVVAGEQYEHFETCGYLRNGQIVDLKVLTRHTVEPTSTDFEYTILENNNVKFTNIAPSS